jgi:hypothetical protein
MMKIK